MNFITKLSGRFRQNNNLEPSSDHDSRPVFDTALELKFALTDSDHISDVMYWPDRLTFAQFNERPFFENKRFENVSFSKTQIEGIDFQKCKFINCQFVNTKFINCEFHECEFQHPDPYKISFTNTYIDPQVFVGTLDKKDVSNKGVSLFQQLYNNAANMNRHDFASTAEFNKRKWERYQLTYDYKKKRIRTRWPLFTFLRKWFANVTSWLTIGYGIRAKFLLYWTIPSTILLIGINYHFWDCLEVTTKNQNDISGNLANVAFYTLTSYVGAYLYAPESLAGKIGLVGQSAFGLFTIAVLLRSFFRLALK